MDTEESELLKKSISISEDNNKMLHSIKRSMRITRLMTFVYWTFIIGSFVGAYYFIQPYLDQIYGAYGGAKSNLDSFGEMFQNFGR